MDFLYRPRDKNGNIIQFPQVFDKVLIGNGCWPTDGDQNDMGFQLKNVLYNFYGWLMYGILTYIIFAECFYFLSNITDVAKAAESFAPAMIGFFIVVRTLHFRLIMQENKALLIRFSNEIWIDGDKYPSLVQRCNRVMRPVFVYFVLMFNVLILYNVMPMFVLVTTDLNIHSTNKKMPYPMVLPYYEQEPPVYFTTYVGALIAGYVVISHFYALDALLLMFISYLSGQFKILQGDIVRLIPECHAEWLKRYGDAGGVSIGGDDAYGYEARKDENRIKLLQNMYTKRLHEISARHNDLISFCQQLNESISFPLLVNVVNSTFLICFCGFQFLLMGLQSIGYFLLCASFFISVILQLYVISYAGAILINYSTNLSTYLYLCNWEGGKLTQESPLILYPEDMDAASLAAKLPLWKHIKYYPANKDFCNKLRFMIMRSYRPIQLNAMNFTILSLETFSKILSSSMSYFALLKTFLEKQK